jgi:hypothetical protein
MRIVQRCLFYEFGEDSSREAIAEDVADRLARFHVDHFPELRMIFDEDEPSQDQVTEDGSEKQGIDVNQPEVIALIADILSKMSDMQNEIHRLNAELSDLRSNIHPIELPPPVVEQDEE